MQSRKREVKMELSRKLLNKAARLVDKLQSDITTGKKRICENYGQREIHKFIDKEIAPLSSGQLTYQEICEIKTKLYLFMFRYTLKYQVFIKGNG